MSTAILFDTEFTEKERTCPLDKAMSQFKSDSINSMHSVMEGKKYHVPFIKQSLITDSVSTVIFLSNNLTDVRINQLFSRFHY